MGRHAKGQPGRHAHAPSKAGSVMNIANSLEIWDVESTYRRLVAALVSGWRQGGAPLVLKPELPGY